MQAALPALAARQRNVERFGLQLAFEVGVGQRLAARGQRCLDGLLGHVDGGAAGFLLVDAELRQPFHQRGHVAGLAQEARLGVLQVGGRGGLPEALGGLLDERVEVEGVRGGGVHLEKRMEP